MTKRLRSKKTKNRVFQNPIVVGAIITGIVGVLIALIQVLPQLDRPEPERTDLPTLTAFIPATATPTVTLTPVESLISVPTITPEIPTETPVSSLPSISCLSTWFRVDTARLPTPTPTPKGIPGSFVECAPITDLGITSISNELIYSKEGFRDVQGVFGISHRINSGYIINMTVTSSRLFNAEFWVALSTNANPGDVDNPPEVISIVIVPATQGNPNLTGTIAIYKNTKKLADKKWAEILNNSGTGRAPFVYDVNIKVDAGRIVITVNNREVANEIGIFPTYLFLGYNKKSAAGSAIVDVSIKNFELTPVR